MKPLMDCARAEILAGAIALGEASDAERNDYRAHLAICTHCLSALGGEREIERAAALVAQARDDERWQPDVRTSLARARNRRWSWRWTAGLAAAAVAAVTIVAVRQPHPAAVHRAPPAMQSALAPQQVRAVAELSNQTAPNREGRAESLAFGDGVARTVTIRVNVNERGKPTSCTILRASGRAALDATLCAAVMRER